MGIAAIGDSLGQIIFCKFCIFRNGQTKRFPNFQKEWSRGEGPDKAAKP